MNKPRTQFESEHAIGDRVYLIDLESYVVVRAVYFSSIGVQYDVGWFHSGERKTAYVFAEEVRKEK